MRKIAAKDATQFNRPRAWPGGLGRWNSERIVSVIRKMIVSMTTPKAANVSGSQCDSPFTYLFIVITFEVFRLCLYL